MAKPDFKNMSDEDAKSFIKEHVFKKFTKNGPMLGKLPKEERDDAINEIYIDLWNNRFNYDPSRSDFTTYAFNRGRGVVKAMMQSFCKVNKIRNKISLEKRQDFYLQKNTLEFSDDVKHLAEVLTNDELKVLNLRFIGNSSVSDIARLFNITEQKVYSIIREAKHKCININEL